MAHQIGHEEDGALEHADEQQIPAGVVLRDLLAELDDAAAQGVLVDQNRAAAGLELRLAHPALLALTPGASTIPGTASTSSPRTTSGHASRSERGTFASTKTSCSFLRLPASRSPGRQPRTCRPGRRDSITQSPQRTLPRSATGPRSTQSRSYSRTA